MWTRSGKNKQTGKIEVVCTDWNGAEFFRASFYDLQEAERAGEDAERRMTAKMSTPSSDLTLDEIMMSDDELLAELAQ